MTGRNGIGSRLVDFFFFFFPHVDWCLPRHAICFGTQPTLLQATRGGSTVAYHGSSPENFHSILNNGLKVMSETRLMKNGAAFGSGM